MENQAASKWMSDLYRSRFEDLSKHMFNFTIEETSILGISDFGDAKFEDAEVQPFVGNLTFMMNNFSNSFHADRDYNSYIYRI